MVVERCDEVDYERTTSWTHVIGHAQERGSGELRSTEVAVGVRAPDPDRRDRTRYAEGEC